MIALLPRARADIFPEAELPSAAELLREGAGLAADWRVGPSAFLSHYGVPSELDYKLRRMGERAIMQHAQIGFRDREKSGEAYARIWEQCAARGVRVDRYGLCLDWSMAVPRGQRDRAMRGTGMILRGPEDFAALTARAPVAPHFGDFVLGFPAAVENTQAALAAGSTAIGNLGQYFTFRVPGWSDDVEATRATVVALGLIAAQPVPVLVHSNIDDGYAAQFTDLACCLGMIEIERFIVEELIGAPIGHCYGHHFSEPLSRLAFQRAMARPGAAPGTLIYGNTTAYRGTASQNYASLAQYLMVDAVAQHLLPTGHAINPVPVTENERIPDIAEVVDAQLFAGRMVGEIGSLQPLLDLGEADKVAESLVSGANRFRSAVLSGLAGMGVVTDDAFEMLLALRRLGARRLERLFGPGVPEANAVGGRRPLVASSLLREIGEMADAALSEVKEPDLESIRRAAPRVLVATTDVHEHGKLLLEEILARTGAVVIDGGVSTDADVLAGLVARHRPDAVALSTYNGVALEYFKQLAGFLREQDLSVPILIGGRLNQIPEGSNTSLPVDVGELLEQSGAIVCRSAAMLVPALCTIGRGKRDMVGDDRLELPTSSV